MAEQKDIVVVGSKNPVKLNAVKDAFAAVFPDRSFDFIAEDVASGVSDQPMGDEETLQGARNRAAACRERHPGTAFCVGLEGGCKKDGDDMACCAWMVVRDAKGAEGRANAALFYLPRTVAKLIDDGLELGTATDRVFSRHNSKQGSGCIGSLTHELISRAEYYRQPLIFAMLPFINQEMYAER